MNITQTCIFFPPLKTKTGTSKLKLTKRDCEIWSHTRLFYDILAFLKKTDLINKFWYKIYDHKIYFNWQTNRAGRNLLIFICGGWITNYFFFRKGGGGDGGGKKRRIYNKLKTAKFSIVWNPDYVEYGMIIYFLLPDHGSPYRVRRLSLI